jgi:ribonuclease Z
MFGVTILGNNSAIPAYNRHPTAQLVTLNNHAFLIDCGEGTQMQMMKYKVRHNKINHIFISHLHGDHYFGLMGILTSMGLMRREAPLHLFAPLLLQEIIQLQLKVADTTLPYELHFHPLTEEGIITDHPNFSISCFNTYHRIPCWGFIIREKKQLRKINRDQAVAFEIPVAYYEQLKTGADYETKEGLLIKNESVTFPNTPPLSYAYAADTLFDERIAEKVKNVSLLYHETTYLKDLDERAMIRFHSTTVQAGEIAKKAEVGKLLIGHFSSKYEKLDDFLSETKSVFHNTDLAIEGVTYMV